MTEPSFSKRFGYTPIKDDEILEDAPIWVRKSYETKVLDIFVNRVRYGTNHGREVITHGLVNSWNIEWDLIVYLRLNSEPDPERPFIYDFLENCEWYHFYDFVEFIAIKLKEVESDSTNEKYGFLAYRNAVNDHFSNTHVVWRMNEYGRLKKESTKVLDDKLQAIENQLTDEFEPAREHYKKAERYSNERPLDPENSIKEIVSAIESVGRVIYPRATTLGDVVKELRTSKLIPQRLITVVEKFYAYASDEPAVRHGAPVGSRVLLDDAEFAMHLGAALIQYLISARKRL